MGESSEDQSSWAQDLAGPASEDALAQPETVPREKLS